MYWWVALAIVLWMAWVWWPEKPDELVGCDTCQCRPCVCPDEVSLSEIGEYDLDLPFWLHPDYDPRDKSERTDESER